MNTNLGIEFGKRLTTLCDGRQGIRAAITCEVKDVNEGDEPVLDFIASDESVDRYNEVIEAAGWELDNYRRSIVMITLPFCTSWAAPMKSQ